MTVADRQVLCHGDSPAKIRSGRFVAGVRAGAIDGQSDVRLLRARERPSIDCGRTVWPANQALGNLPMYLPLDSGTMEAKRSIFT